MKTRGVLAVLILSSLLKAQSDSIIISEIMFYSLSGSNEFIEIYNFSSTQSIDLSGYSVKYYSSSPDTIVSGGQGTILPPESYAVILEGDYDMENGIYRNIIPPSALLLKINNNAFGSNGMANTASRPVWLNSAGGEIQDSYFYSANNSQAISDEKKLLVKDTSSVLWTNSIIHNGTPGFRNSVLLYSHDIEISSFFAEPENPAAGDDIMFTAVIRNSGTEAAELITVNFYNDVNFDSTGSPSEIIYSESIGLINSSDSVIVYHTFPSAAPGIYNFIAEAEYVQDEFLGNNVSFTNITVRQEIAVSSIIINEIMYAPQNGEPEWIEILNTTDEILNLKNWGIGDAVSAYYITTNNYYIQPHSYEVLAKDSSLSDYYPFTYEFLEVYLPSLNNTGDAVVLYGSYGEIIDSLYYFPYWGGSHNRSLERISPSGSSLSSENWTSSINRYRATPGFINSVTPKNNDAVLSSFYTEEKYAVAGEYVNFIVSVKNNGNNILENIDLSVYYDADADSVIGQSDEIKIFNLPEILPGDSAVFSFGYNGFTIGTNYFAARINYADDDTCNNISFYNLQCIEINFSRNDLLINEIMHAPADEPEWIELYNNSSENINLKNFRIADGMDSVFLIKQDFIFEAGEYLVISGDSLLLQKRNIPSKFIRASLPALNNTGDKIILIDSLGRVIDSLEYSSGWGGKSGCSIERINFNISSSDSTNWGTSINKHKGSPGYINSLSPKDYDACISGIIIDPEYPVKNDSVKIFIKIKNNGSQLAEGVINLFKDTDLDSIPDELISGSQISITGNDSVIYDPHYLIPGITSQQNIYAEVILANDQDTTNNYFLKTIKCGYRSGSIIMNEVLFNPQTGESEWIEFYNRSADTINITGWGIRDIFTGQSVSKINMNYFLLPKSYIVLSADSNIYDCHRIIPSGVIICNIPNLNNDADGVVLSDDRNIVIDSVFYSGQSADNRSLERISPEISSTLNNNWGRSKDIELSTPGRINSITIKDFDIAAGGLFIDPRFPCKGDTLNISAVIKNYGINSCSGYYVKFLAGGMNSQSDSVISIVQGTLLNGGDSVEIGCPVKLVLTDPVKIAADIEFPGDNDPVNNFIERKIYPGERSGIIIINEIMYDPVDGECEWVEIYNPSEYPQNLKNWSISDILPSPTKSFISSEDFYIGSGEYIVAAGDSSVLKKYPAAVKLLSVKFGALSSVSDGIILYDYRDGIIDSIKYKSSWGGRNGRSLERKSFNKASSDSSNWNTSLSVNHATPGAVNSVSNIGENKRASVIINEIMYEPDIDNCEFIELYNRSGDNINMGGWRLDCGGSSFIISDTSFIAGDKSYLIFAADSVIFEKYYIDKNLVLISDKSSFGLSSSGEMLMLKDLNGAVIDSFNYSPDFHNRNYLITKNRSLERINPDVESTESSNWSSCTFPEGATPGRENSIFTELSPVSSGVLISPNPFSPDNDGYEDFAVINYNFRTPAPLLRIRIFDNTGRLVRTLADNLPAGSEGEFVYDGRDDNGRALRIGIYILFVEAVGNNGVETYKSAFVIARKL